MRFSIKNQTFKSQKCEFNVASMQAYSYSWWKFVEVRQGVVYFNGARYSMQTSKQQDNVRTLLDSMGIKYRTMYVGTGLQNIPRAIEELEVKIKNTLSEIANPKSRAKTNKGRQERIKNLKKQIEQLTAYNKLEVEKEYVLGFKARKYLEEVIKNQRAKAKLGLKKDINKNTSKDQSVKYEAKLVNGANESSNRTVIRNFTLIKGGKV